MGKKLWDAVLKWNDRIQHNEVAVIDEHERNMCFLYMLSSVSIFFLGVKLMGVFVDPIKDSYTARLIELSNLLLILIFWRAGLVQVREVGIRVDAKTLKKTLIRCGLIAAAILLLMFPVRFIKSLADPTITVIPPLDLLAYIKKYWYYGFIAVYQEFMIKCLMQEKMKEMYGPGHVHLAIITCGMTFFVYHQAYPLYYMFGAAAMCVVTGYLYETDRNIWGCSLVHYSVAFMSYCVGLR